MAQGFLSPDADLALGAWTNESGGSTLFESLDEAGSPVDADYIRSSSYPTNDTCIVRLSNPSGTVDTEQPVIIHYRYRKTPSAALLDLTVELVELSSPDTVIASWEHVDVSDGFVTAEQTLTEGEVASIADFDALALRFTVSYRDSVNLEPWLVWPQMLHRPENVLPQQGLKTLTGAGDSISWVIQAPSDMEVSHLAPRIGTASGSPTVTCSVNAVDPATGDLDGLWATSTEATSGTLTSNTTPVLALGATASITRGQVVAFTVTLASGTSAVIAAPAGLVQLTSGMPYFLDDGVTQSGFTASGLAIGSSASTFYSLPGFFPFTSIPLNAAGAFNNSTATTRRGVRFVAPFTTYLIGARLIQHISHNGNYELRLYDEAGTTLIGTATVVDGTIKRDIQRYVDVYLASPEDLLLTAGVTYRFVLVPTSTTNCYFTRLNLASSDFYSAHHGADWQYTEYDGANWNDSIVAVPVIDLFFGEP